MKVNIFYIQLVLVLFLFLVPVLVQAQPTFGDDVEDVPVDGSLSLLVAASMGYGIKKLKSHKKKHRMN